jgi:hypothetical protein
MRVAITTTIITYVDLSEGVTVEEARKEIFGRYSESVEEHDYVDDILSVQSNSVVFDDVIVGTSIEHSFGVV